MAFECYNVVNGMLQQSYRVLQHSCGMLQHSYGVLKHSCGMLQHSCVRLQHSCGTRLWDFKNIMECCNTAYGMLQQSLCDVTKHLWNVTALLNSF